MSDLSSLTSLSDTDSDDQMVPTVRIFRDTTNAFEMYDDINFAMRFRFTKQSVMDLLHLFGALIEPQTFRNKSICARDQLLITLRFYATGAFYKIVGDCFNVDAGSVCRIVRRVTHHLALLRGQYVNMPRTAEEINSVKHEFFQIRNFPNVIGAIDCTHIRIQSPGGDNGELYRNRKGYFSINCQVVCDARLRVRNIVARWYGSVHDSTIFADSALNAELINGNFGPNSYLLGDSGYPCKPYLLTPLLNPRTPAENNYNTAHIATRNVIERCFGVVKRRFPCIGLGLRCHVRKILPIIVACFVLHNIAIQFNDNDIVDDPVIIVPEEEEHHANIINNDNMNNTAVRTALIETVFMR